MTIHSPSRNLPHRMELPSGREAIRPILLSFPIAYFTAALVTDLAYWQTADVMWESFSDWLITAGLVTAGFAAIIFVIDFVRGKRSRIGDCPRAAVESREGSTISWNLNSIGAD